jgi:site-specific recombinase XerD
MEHEVPITTDSTGTVGHSELEAAIGEYIADLREKRYSPVTLEGHSRKLRQFASFAESERAIALSSVPGEVDRFISNLRLDRCYGKLCAQLLCRFIRHLRQRGRIPALCPPKERRPFAGVFEEYERFLRDDRGVSESGIAVIRSACLAFLDHAETSRISALASIRPETIHQFILQQGQRYTRRTMSGRCSALRGFLAHLYRRGRIPADLSALVLAPRIYLREGCPRFLTPPEVRAVLSSVDKRTRLGRRDYAILLLLATYGLRGIEVLRLELDDIDWRAEKLHVRRRKVGNASIYPFSHRVGEAILAYLQRGRPESTSRRLFLTGRAPYGPLKTTASLRDIVLRQLDRAGTHVERPGPHLFRYSCAQGLLQKGFPLKTIADYLGHRDTRTTRGYTRIAIEELREIALGDGEDVV